MTDAQFTHLRSLKEFHGKAHAGDFRTCPECRAMLYGEKVADRIQQAEAEMIACELNALEGYASMLDAAFNVIT